MSAPTNPNSVEQHAVPFLLRSLKCRPRGITLIEVIVGLVMLSTLLTVILISTGKLRQQQKAALQKLDAVRILDDLTGEFFREGFPKLDSTGKVASRSDRYWQVTGKPNAIAPDSLFDIRISIHVADAASVGSVALSPRTLPRLVAVEVLVSGDSIGRYHK